MPKPIICKPHFIPYDVCIEPKTGEYCFITEVNLNLHQSEDKHQWSYSVIAFRPTLLSKSAWYKGDDLIYVCNLFELIASASKHNMSSTNYEFILKNNRR